MRDLAESHIPDASRLPDGYVTELSPAVPALVETIVSRMSIDAVGLFIDYGFPASEYYHPQRSTGTLMAHRRHRASTDVLACPGLQDITAHVDFTAVARAVDRAGGVVLGFASQSAFLIDCGVAELLVGDAADTAGWARQASALQTLLSEAEMGELFKVLGFARVDRPMVGIRRSRSFRDAMNRRYEMSDFIWHG